MMLRKIKQNKRDKKCWDEYRIFVFYRVARERLFDKVTLGRDLKGVKESLQMLSLTVSQAEKYKLQKLLSKEQIWTV